MFKTKLVILILFALIFVSGCSQSIENKILGAWEGIEDKCDSDISDISNEITFYDDQTVAGIEGFQEYKIEETNNNDYDYVVLSGGYEDTTKFRVHVTKDDVLNIVNDNYDDDFTEITACQMKKVND